MKKWLSRIGFVVLIIIGALFLIAAWAETDRTVLEGYKQNDELRTIKPGWQGTPVDEKDRFMNHEFPFLPSMADLLKWKLGGNNFKQEKENDTGRLEVKDPRPFLSSNEDGILWLGHASFFIRINGVSILTDPIFGKPPVVRRFVEVPSPIDDLKQVDYVLISHDHRDHMDETTLRAIAEKFPKAAQLMFRKSTPPQTPESETLETRS